MQRPVLWLSGISLTALALAFVIRALTLPPHLDAWQSLEGAAYLDKHHARTSFAITALPWIEDGISDAEREATQSLVNLATTDVHVLAAVVERPWASDGLDGDEVRAIKALRPLAERSPAAVIDIANMDFLETVEGIDADGLTLLSSLQWRPATFSALLQEPWINDGLARYEQAILSYFGEGSVLDEDSILPVVKALLQEPWVWDGLSAAELDLLPTVPWDVAESPEDLASVTRLLSTLVTEPWTLDGLSAAERDLLLAVPWGAGDSPERAASVTRLLSTLVAEPWTLDGLSAAERDLLLAVPWGAASTPERAASVTRLLSTLVMEPWALDGLSAAERDLLLAAPWGAGDSPERAASVTRLLSTLVMEPWTLDGLSGAERDLLLAVPWGVADSPERAASVTRLLSTLIPYSWVGDGLTADEAQVVAGLAVIDAPWEALGVVVSYAWVQDGIAEEEVRFLPHYRRLLEAAGPEGAPTLSVMLQFPWVTDGVLPDEALGIGSLADLLAASSPDIVDVIQTIANYPWLADGVEPAETLSLGTLGELVDVLGEDGEGFLRALASQRWLHDGVDAAEGDLLQVYVTAAAELPPGVDMPSPVATYPWLNNGVTPEKLSYVQSILYVARDLTRVAPNMAAAVIEGSLMIPEREIGRTSEALSMLVAFFPDAEQIYAELNREVERLRWLSDGVSETEVRWLVSFSGFARELRGEHGDLVDSTLQRRWTRDSISRDEVDWLDQYRRLLEKSGPDARPLALDVVQVVDRLPWLSSGVSRTDVRWLENFAGFVLALDGEHADLAHSMLQRPWTRDGISHGEVDWLDQYRRLLEESGPAARPFTLDIVRGVDRLPWLADGVSATEVRWLSAFAGFALALDSGYEDLAHSALQRPWTRDGISSYEVEWVYRHSLLLERSGPAARPYVLDIVREVDRLPWLTAGVSGTDVRWLDAFSSFALALDSEHGDLAHSVLQRPWTRDGVSSHEIEWMHLNGIILEESGPAARQAALDIVREVAQLPWTAEELPLTGVVWLGSFSGLVLALDGEHAHLTLSVLHRPWTRDGVSKLAVDWLDHYRRLLEESDPATRQSLLDLATELNELPWLPENISQIDLWWLGNFLAFVHELNGEHADIMHSVIHRPWSHDGILRHEVEWIHQYRRLLEESDPAARHMAVDLAALPAFYDSVDPFDAAILGWLAIKGLLEAPEIIDKPWMRDGISFDDLVVLIAYVDASNRSRFQYADLVREHHMAQRTISLPLAGEVGLYVVRHTPFPEDDPSLDLMEEVIVKLEAFMGVPFPMDNAVMFMIEPSTAYGEPPQRGVGYSLGSHIVAAPPRHNPGYHLMVYHEMAHLYWGGHTGAPPWWTEGTAGFLPDYARHELGHEHIETRYGNLLTDTQRECRNRGISNVSDYYMVQQSYPGFAADRTICVYALGEIFLVEMYMLLGFDAVSGAMRQLYVEARDSGWLDPITDQKIYDAFVAYTPAEALAEFQTLFERLHGGDRVTIPSTVSI